MEKWLSTALAYPWCHLAASPTKPALVSTLDAQQGSRRRSGSALFLLLFIFFIVPIRGDASKVTVPIELDYPLVRQLLVEQLFNTPDQGAEILHDPSGCSHIILANPRLGARGSELEIFTEVRVRLGVGALGGCTDLLQWQGGAGFLVSAVIQPGGTSVQLEPVESWLVAADGSKINSGRIWDLAKDRFRPLFRRFRLDLAPSVNALGTILPDVLPRHSRQQVQAIVGSLRLTDLRVSPTAIDVQLSFQVAELPEQPRSEAVLSASELQQWESRWQMMDALFTFAVKYYASATSLQELRSALLDILLDSRYRLHDALTSPASRSNDPVRRWFLDSWKSLSPVIRGIALEQTGQRTLLWLSLLTATDALYALDRLGPAVGLDISADGLRRLARLINDKTDLDPLRYDQAVDPDLQRLFQLPSPLEREQPSGFRFDLWPLRLAWAETSIERLDRWVPSKDQLGDYLPLVASLLKESAEETLQREGLKPPVARLFRKLVLATAWQESCWRQYVVSKKRIEPLRSGTGDVGLMQINEKVWRGFYSIQKLRWDIGYNSRAGAEVLLNYLVRYALKEGEDRRPGGLDNLARASYSAYNGGPSQFSRYRNPAVASHHKKVDTAFWKKYQQVKAGNELDVARCLGGEKAGLVSRRPVETTAKKSASGRQKEVVAGATAAAARDPGERWVLAQQKDHFTLQLAVFSERESARKFITQQSLAGQVSIFAVRKGDTTRFAVLYGSYAKRIDADKEKRRLKHLKPWIRQFAEVREAAR